MVRASHAERTNAHPACVALSPAGNPEARTSGSGDGGRLLQEDHRACEKLWEVLRCELRGCGMGGPRRWLRPGRGGGPDERGLREVNDVRQEEEPLTGP